MNQRRVIGSSLIVALGLLLCLGRVATAEDAAKGNVSGTWKWTVTRQNGDSMEFSLHLKQDGEKVTGALTGRDNKETEIKDGSIKNGELTFKVTRKFNDREVTSTYTGKVEGDTLKGSIEMTGRDGQPRKRDWEAKRSTEKVS